MAEKTNMIALRLNNEQMSAINEWSRQHGVSISQVIRAAIEQMTGAKS
jgi:predicted DNA binding CopG/RHH family protein